MKVLALLYVAFQLSSVIAIPMPDPAAAPINGGVSPRDFKHAIGKRGFRGIEWVSDPLKDKRDPKYNDLKERPRDVPDSVPIGDTSNEKKNKPKKANLHRRIGMRPPKHPVPSDLTGRDSGPYQVYVDERATAQKPDLGRRDGEIGHAKTPKAPPVNGLTGRDESKRDFSIDIPPKPVNQLDSNSYEGLSNGFKRPN
ncbi:UNVERIFIED_CONTAM: hypothetical protein HDU68_008798 [Siphonaria sp. JEL0065]|nr:hypothetical protein HDU68_008798 [Siphonaria sp. JEL0065]